MGVSLIGLIVFQAYWIRNAIDISEDKYRREFHAALNQVVKDLERREIMYTAVQKMEYRQGDVTVIGLDSIQFIRKNNDTSDREKYLLTDEGVRKWLLQDSNHIVKPGGELVIDFSREISESGELIDSDAVVALKHMEAKIDSIKEYDPESRSTIEKVREKSQMVTVVLNELLSKERKINNRIDPDQLKTLLNENLQERGIQPEYEYGVLDEKQNKFIFASTEEKMPLRSSEFKVRLFPGDIIDQGNYLLVMPESLEFLAIRDIWLSLISSILFVVLIILCFAYALHIILRQKKVSEIKNDFINNMTHEFKTPISTVSLAVEALQDKEIVHDPGFVSRYLDIIREENKRLGLQVEKVLQMATLERNDYKLKIERLDVHEMIENALQNIHLQIERKDGKVFKKFNAENSLVQSDEVHLTNIIYNLLDNANKYSPDQPEVTLETENSAGQIIIRVRDNGIGMPKDAMNKIFEKFYRVPTGNIHDVKGFGLGLSYVKTMLDVLGGKIEVHSQHYKGSTFEIYLPLAYET